MDIERYEALVCVIETGSLSAAAQKLGYTPSGISRMMAALEEENGFPLLQRTREGTVPTEDCTKLLPAIREMIFTSEKYRQQAAGIRGITTGTVTVGTAYNACYRWLAEMTSAFHQIHPGIRIQLKNGYSTGLVEMMKDHQVDLCIISLREGDHSWTPLREDPVVAWIPEDHPLAKGTRFPVGAYAQESYIDIYPGQDSDNSRVLRSCGIRPNIQFTTMDSFAAYSMVEAGLGIAMNNQLNEPPRDGGVKILPLEPEQHITIGLAAAKDLSPAAQAFAEFIGKQSKKEIFDI